MVYFTRIALAPTTRFERGKGLTLMKKFPSETEPQIRATLGDPRKNTEQYFRMMRFVQNTLKINLDCRFDEVILVSYLYQGIRITDWVKNYWVNDEEVKEMTRQEDRKLLCQLYDSIGRKKFYEQMGL